MVVSGIAFGIVAAALVPTMIVLVRRRSATSSRTVSAPEETPAAVWKGGMKSRTVSATSGTARLEMLGWGVRVRGRGLWRALLPIWEARYGELTIARIVEWPVGNRGVIFHANGPAVPLVFVTLRGDEILDALAARGVTVDRSVTRLRLADLVNNA
jgi:hypothetical protein